MTSTTVVGRPFALGSGPWKTLDPFLFCVFNDQKFPKSTPNTLGPDPQLLRGREITSDFSNKDGWSMFHGETVPGFPAHPHRGFETVTVVNKGVVDHFDSTGATGRYGNGDVQWLTAGNGVQHSEMIPLVNMNAENPLELFQLWLNLPSKTKYVEPHFKMFWAPTIPVVQIGDATVRVVAGTEFPGVVPPSPPPASWASDDAGEVAIWIIKLPSGGKLTLPIAAGGSKVNRSAYYFRGTSGGVSFGSAEAGAAADAQVQLNQGIQLNAGVPTTITTDAKGPAEVLILQGRPIGEPVVQHGPFVTNTRQEMNETFQMYSRTRFGGWPWPSNDYHHPREQKRFAKFPDGHVEDAPELKETGTA